MMTDKQRAIFSKMLDYNWEVVQKKQELANAEKELARLDTELRESMGMEAYIKFMNQGQAMFAPKQD